MYITQRAREYILVIRHKDTNNEDLTFNLLGTEILKLEHITTPLTQ